MTADKEGGAAFAECNLVFGTAILNLNPQAQETDTDSYFPFPSSSSSHISIICLAKVNSLPVQP